MGVSPENQETSIMWIAVDATNLIEIIQLLIINKHSLPNKYTNKNLGKSCIYYYFKSIVYINLKPSNKLPKVK